MIALDWQSSENRILMNPRFSLPEKNEILAMLKKSPPLQGHFWIATSGSAGRIKWTALSKEAVLASAAAVNTFLDSSASDIWLNPLPHFHVGGLGIFARAYLCQAKAIDGYDLMQHNWDPSRYCDFLCHHNATLTSLVPAQVYDLVKLEKKAPEALRAIIVGGGILSEEIYTKAIQLGWKLLPSYGLTECASQVATVSPNDRLTFPFPKATLLPHIQAYINSTGRLTLKSPSLLTLYAIKNENGVEFIDPKKDGWFETDDLGELEGRTLKIKGRQSHFIKIGGESVDLLRLQRILEEIKALCPFAYDMALAPIPDGRLGSVIHLAVAAIPDKVIDDIVAIYQNKVLPFEKIKQIHYIDAIPRSDLGKLIINSLINKIEAKNIK
jgi:O-succinylbenzoic acid--CoA ligase